MRFAACLAVLLSFGACVACLAVLLSLSACTAEPAGPVDSVDGQWRGTITTEGGITTVVNESGSVWGGTARLIEEASIGVDQGDDEYMLGYISGIVANDDWIFVLDGQVPIVRVYDHNGNHDRDIGRAGQGPGEFEQPLDVGLLPDGRLVVRQPARLDLFYPDGRVSDTWPINSGFYSTKDMVIGADGTVYIPDRIREGDDFTDQRSSMQAIGPAGPTGDPIPAPDLEVEQNQLVASFAGGGMLSMNVPFAPSLQWTLLPNGTMIGGVNDTYAFQMSYLDGTARRVEKSYEPVPVPPEEAESRTRSITARLRRSDPDWRWNGPPIPDTKPAYWNLIPDRSGRIWVLRTVETKRLADCEEDSPETVQTRPRSCWESVDGLDVFDGSGRYLGDVEIPPGVEFTPTPFIKDDLVIAAFEDDLGIPMVKRYRLVLPF
jgi:hypothetical protein